MATICPSITASSIEEYRVQIEKVVHLAKRLHIDLTDGELTSTKLIAPKDAWWPVGFKADFHLMFLQPMPAVKIIMDHKPNLVIVHAEAQGDFAQVATFCHAHDVKVGIALLPQTSTETIVPALDSIDHVLIFSGDLGSFGGHADTALLEKVGLLKSLKPELEIGWDGGVNDQNVAELLTGGVDVLNVGGYIQEAPDPAKAYTALQRIADETGTT